MASRREQAFLSWRKLAMWPPAFLLLLGLTVPAMGEVPEQRLVLAGQWKISAAYRVNSEKEQQVVLRTFVRKDGAWVRLHERHVDSAYNPRLELRSDLRSEGRPIALLKYQFGAALEVLDVYAVRSNTLTRIQSLEAGAFEWSSSSRDGATPLVAIPGSMDSQKTFYVWKSNQFSPLNH